MRGFTVRGSSCPSDRKHAGRRARQEAIALSRSECLGQAVADESRSALDGYVREGARQMLQRALECEVEAFLADHAARTDQRGRKHVVRNGYLPARTIMTGAGPLEIEQPRVRDKAPRADERVVITSAILPPYLRKSRSIEELIPWLYLKGVSTGDYAEASQPLLGTDAKGLSPNVIVRLKEKWGQEYEEWSRRDLSGEEFVYVWAALREVSPTTKEQRCWVHKTANVLNKMPKALQAKAKSDLHQIWLAGTREMATKAFDHFLEKYGPKYEAACSCLSKDRDVLLAFYDFPAEHWGHLRTTNPIESTFSTIRLRHRRTKGSGSRKASLTMMFKLAQSASRRWRRLSAHHQIVLVLEGRIFTDGVLQNAA